MKLFASLIVSIYAFSAFAVDFDPAACPNLAVKIYPGNGSWRVFHATGSIYLHSALGYDSVGVLTVGKHSQKRMRTILRFDMGLGKSSQLNFLMTIPDTEVHQYSLATESYWVKGPKTVPLKTVHCSEGKIVFRCTNSIRHHITIDLKTNTAECAPGYLGKKFPVEWNKDGFEIKGLSGDEGKFEFIMPLSNYRGCDGGITTVRRKIGTRFLLFPVYQTFYLEPGK